MSVLLLKLIYYGADVVVHLLLLKFSMVRIVKTLPKFTYSQHQVEKKVQECPIGPFPLNFFFVFYSPLATNLEIFPI